MRIWLPSSSHRPPALRPGTLQQHRHTHVDVRVAQVWRIVPEAHFGWTALQLQHHMADTIVNGLERVPGMRFETKAQVRRTEGEAVHARLGKLAGLGDGLNGLDLEPENTVVVPPLSIRTAVVPAFDTAPGSAAPAPVAKLRVVKIRQGLIHCGLVFDLWDLDSRGAQVKQVADKVRMTRMLDAELHR